MYSSPSLKLGSPLTLTSLIWIKLESRMLRPTVPLGKVPLNMTVTLGDTPGVDVAVGEGDRVRSSVGVMVLVATGALMGAVAVRVTVSGLGA